MPPPPTRRERAPSLKPQCGPLSFFDLLDRITKPDGDEVGLWSSRDDLVLAKLPGNGFVLRTDVKSYYASIDHFLLSDQLAVHIKGGMLYPDVAR